MAFSEFRQRFEGLLPPNNKPKGERKSMAEIKN
jgi:hypothetical protein